MKEILINWTWSKLKISVLWKTVFWELEDKSDWEKIFTKDISKKDYTQNIQRTFKTQQEENKPFKLKKQNKTWGKDLDTSPKKIYRWQISIWKDTPPHVIREMQMKITMRYHYKSIRMAKIQNTNTIKCW